MSETLAESRFSTTFEAQEFSGRIRTELLPSSDFLSYQVASASNFHSHAWSSFCSRDGCLARSGEGTRVCLTHPIPFRTMQYHSVPNNTIQYHVIYHSVLCNAIQYHAILFNTIQYHAVLTTTHMQYHSVLCNTIQYYTIPCSIDYHAHVSA